MAQRIIYPNDSGGVSIVICHKEDGAPLFPWSLEDEAKRVVPAGVPYKLISLTDIPEDRTQRDLWTADFSEPDGYGGGLTTQEEGE